MRKRFWQFSRYTFKSASATVFVKGIKRAGMMDRPAELGMQPGDAIPLECRACGHVPPPLPRSRIIEWLDSVKPDSDGYGIRRVSW